MKLYIADAFTEKTFGGNPAGVVLIGNGDDFPPEEIMLKTAAELRYSETAFIRQLGDNEFNIRYFTPAAEVELCGHATIAAFQCLRDAGLVHSGSICTNRTLAGDLQIIVKDDFIMMEMASPKFIKAIDDQKSVDELYNIMGIRYEPVFAHSGDPLMPEIISTGLPDIIMPVSSPAQLSETAPDFDALSELSKRYGVTGAHVFTLNSDKPEITAECRNFAPLYDIDEEAATGTASGALTYYLYRHGLIEDNTCLFLQGEAMGRPSSICTCIDVSDGSVKIQAGGNAAILVRGEITL